MWGKKDLINEIIGFSGLIFFPWLIVKCVVRFDGFVKFKKPMAINGRNWPFWNFQHYMVLHNLWLGVKNTFINHLLGHPLMDENIVVFAISHVDKW